MKPKPRSEPAMTTMPPTVTRRGPMRSNSMPEMGDSTIPAIDAGSMTMPVVVAEAPMPFCTSSGRMTFVAATAALMSVTMSAAMRKLRVLRQRSSSMGTSSAS